MSSDIVIVPKKNIDARFVALPDDKMVALQVTMSADSVRDLLMAAVDKDGSATLFIRIKQEEGFKNFMHDAMEAGASIWPEVAKAWRGR